jgi:hypothetical protein
MDEKLLELVSDDSVFGRWYTQITEILKQKNVPDTRMPTKAHFLSRVFTWIDHSKLELWLMQYADLEAVADDELEKVEVPDETY